MSGPERSLYQAMGVAPDASGSEVRDAYRRLVRSLHPDRFMDASPAERRLADRRMREVTEAWSVLGDPTRRRDYDAARRDPSPRPPPPSTGSGAAPPRAVVDDPDDPDDDVELSPAAAFLLRRGPVLVLLFIAVGLFVGTALADGRRDRERLDPLDPPATTACLAPLECP